VVEVNNLCRCRTGMVIIMKYIYDYVKSGKEVLRGFYDLVFPVVESLKRKGAEYFLLGCTELSTLADIPDFCHAFNYVDSSLELALAAIRKCGYEIKDSLQTDTGFAK